MPEGACEGIQVVEMGAGSIAGSLAGMLLADSGARVVKIEPPEGDRLREGRTSGFLVWNRGKESIVADLREPSGRAAAREVIDSADAVIEAFATGTVESWGLDYDTVRSANPGLVYCSIKGFGSRGRYAHLQAYEGVVAAKVGFWTMGDFGIRPEPIFNAGQMASTGAGHMAAGGILAALIAREKSGRGQRLETTLVQGLGAFDYFGMTSWQDAQRKAAAAGSGPHEYSAFSGASRISFFAPTGDGRWVNFTHMMPHQAQALSRVAGLAHTISDPRFARQPIFDTAEDAQEWETMVWEAIRTKSYAEWEPLLLADPDIAFEMARHSEEALDHIQIRHNGERIVVNDPEHGPVEQVGPVASFSRTPVSIARSAPRLDENAGPFRRSILARTAEMPKHPLSGITIVELGYFYGMPFGLTLAASLGARVVKFEANGGDPMRTAFGLPEVSAAKVLEGKESLAVDLTTAEGKEIAHRLVERADAFVNGFRPGVAERLGLDEDTIKTINPGLLHVHASGYGASGPYSHRAIYAGVASALAGQVHRHAGYWLDPDLATSLSTTEAQAIVLPRLRGPVDGDSNAALAVFTTLMLGLFERARSQRGQSVTTSMIGANTLAYADDANRYRGKEPIPLADPENYGLNALYRIYPGATGTVFVAATRQKEWEALAVALDNGHLIDDERFLTCERRRVNDAEVVAVLSDIFRTRSAEDWEAALAPKGIACVAASSVGSSEFHCTDPVMRETEMVIEVDHPILGRILRHGIPVRFSDTPGTAEPGPRVGQHTDQILSELGYTPAQIAAFHAARVVFG